MSFEEKPFLILFVITYGLWLLVRRNEPRAVALLLSASLLFYGWRHWQLLPILIAYCVIDWLVARWIEAGRRPRTALTVGVTFNLAVLCFYKYTPLVAKTLSPWLGVRLMTRADYEAWSIPFGISFYAFTGVAYLVDVYRRETPAERSLVRYTLSAVFFPHLVAGPILRASEFLNKLRPGQMPRKAEALAEAWWLIARGFFKKVVIADRLALAADPFFAHVADPTTAGVWALPFVYLYALQIYFDFSAYTDLARGLGLLFGYRWPDNFHLPYIATSVADFWRRWHITLSQFLRDYLYIPLGGSRHGWLRTNVNLMVTMLLGGLWHGASWSFLLWGGLHGSFLVLHRVWRATPIAGMLDAISGPARWLWTAFSVALTFHCVCLAWCFFRLAALPDSLTCVKKWVVFDRDKMFSETVFDPSLWAVLLGYGLLVVLVTQTAKLAAADRPFVSGLQWGIRAALLLLAVVLTPGGTAPAFIYFQF